MGLWPRFPVSAENRYLKALPRYCKCSSFLLDSRKWIPLRIHKSKKCYKKRKMSLPCILAFLFYISKDTNKQTNKQTDEQTNKNAAVWMFYLNLSRQAAYLVIIRTRTYNRHIRNILFNFFSKCNFCESVVHFLMVIFRQSTGNVSIYLLQCQVPSLQWFKYPFQYWQQYSMLRLKKPR